MWPILVISWNLIGRVAAELLRGYVRVVAVRFGVYKGEQRDFISSFSSGFSSAGLIQACSC